MKIGAEPDPSRIYAARIKRAAEAFIVETGAGVCLAYVYFAEASRRAATGRMSEDEARSVAQRIARALSRLEPS